MVTNLRFQNFKSWHDTGIIRFAPLTGVFGTNSSGKTAILQLLLLLKQTVESADVQQALKLDGPYVDLGSVEDMLYQHDLNNPFDFELGWNLSDVLSIDELHHQLRHLALNVELKATPAGIIIDHFTYTLDDDVYEFGMRNLGGGLLYEFLKQGVDWKPEQTLSSPPTKSYTFPPVTYAQYPQAKFLSALVLEFEKLTQRITYLGPLREYPSRIYRWTGDTPQIGVRGEYAVQALLGVRSERRGVLTQVKRWLKQLGLVHTFDLQRIAPNRREYEARIKVKPDSPEVVLTDVGFGVSQVLPVLALCALAQPGDILLMEQPEIHLHPAVQAGLADVLIETIGRGVQIVLESHSEHLLRRLQRRIAEERLVAADIALYFCAADDTGTSQLTALEVDDYGNITNWPAGFFGDELGDLVAMTEAAMMRQLALEHP